MTRARALPVEHSHQDEWGNPSLPWTGRVRSIRRLAGGLAAGTALAIAVASTAASLVASPDAGVDIAADGQVIFVSPAGFAWSAGIRAGQEAVTLPDTTAGGWKLETRAGDMLISAEAAAAVAVLRESAPLAATATLFGVLAVILLRGHRGWVAVVACLSLAAAVPSLQLSGNLWLSGLGMATATIAPAMWLAWRPRLPLALSVVASAAILVLIVAWVVARAVALPPYDRLENVRDAVAFYGLTAVLLASVVAPIVGGLGAPGRGVRLGDALLLALVGGLTLGLVAILSPVVAGGLAVGAVLAVPAWRRWVADRAERTLLADLREHAQLEAAEAERAHLARELHDVPLQQLAGIIRRLELLPEARAESDELRTVAEQLRGLATELRPPVLDDLGLAPALEFLAEAASTDEIDVVTEVEDRTSLDAGGRPPAEIELAIFRIAQEAVTNALQHAGASEVRLTGEVTADRVTLAVTDDGRGLDDAEVRAAGRRGRLGLASMRRRAEAIDAELQIAGSDEGTRVAIRWAR
ncbi:MAG: sensor histidine kinase [Chloroflexota bacterium]